MDAEDFMKYGLDSDLSLSEDEDREKKSANNSPGKYV
jgi:hypothetical protein